MLKTIASLGSKRFERIGRTKANKILQGINNYAIRSKLRNEVKYKFGTGKVSLKDFTKNISQTYSPLAASRFIDAVIQHAKKETSAKTDSKKTEVDTIKAKNLQTAKRLTADRPEFFRETGEETKFAGGSVFTRGPRIKGTAKERFGLGSQYSVSALNSNNNKIPDKPAPKASAAGAHPPIKLVA